MKESDRQENLIKSMLLILTGPIRQGYQVKRQEMSLKAALDLQCPSAKAMIDSEACSVKTADLVS